MNIFDRIHIAALNAGTDIEYAIAMRKFRAAGNRDYEVANTSNDNTTATTSNETETNPSNEVQSNKGADNEHSSEETGAEKPPEARPKRKPSTTSASAVVEESAEAAMNGGIGGIRDDNPNIINLGFGVVIDQNKLNEGESTIPDFGSMSQFQMTPPVNMYLEHLEQQKLAQQQAAQAAVHQPGTGLHKVDQPITPKPPVERAKEDSVDIDLSNIHIDSEPPKAPNAWPEVVAGPLPQAEPVVQPESVPIFDNSHLTGKFKYLAAIEGIALKCGVQVQMAERVGQNGLPNGLISCIVYTGDSKPNPFKGFTVDTGVIIDRRAKVFPGIVSIGYEDMQAYPVLISKQENGNYKSKNVINEKLFTDIFIGGVNALDPKSGMYTPDYLELNKLVAIITMPTNNMNGEIRRAVRERLKAAMNAGVFAKALQIDPNSRFRFKSYDKKNRSFVLTNAGTPYRFGGQVLSTKLIEIAFLPDGKTTINF